MIYLCRASQRLDVILDAVQIKVGVVVLVDNDVLRSPVKRPGVGESVKVGPREKGVLSQEL